MSHINPSIGNEAVIPSVESNVFDDHQADRFAVGIIAVGNEVLPGMDTEFLAYLRLRANVYADQTNMISKELVADDGTERDTDDNRSVHFAVFENDHSRARVVGAMRLIIKNAEDARELPVEEFFDEAFQDEPAPLNSTEVSRYICRHEDASVQNSLKWLLYTKALGYVMTHDLGPTYGVVEEPLEADLRRNNIPVERIADPKYVEEYAADNLGLRIDTDTLAAIMGLKDPKVMKHLKASENDFAYTGSTVAEQVVA